MSWLPVCDRSSVQSRDRISGKVDSAFESRFGANRAVRRQVPEASDTAQDPIGLAAGPTEVAPTIAESLAG